MRVGSRTGILAAAATLLLAGCASTKPGSKPSDSSAPPPSPAPRGASISAPLYPGDTSEERAFVDELPVPTHQVQPAEVSYGATGTVTVLALVDRDGRVRDTKVAKSIPALDSLAMETVRQWTFKPGRSKGKPVETWVSVPVVFKPR
jgi:protein TonB